MFTDFAKLFYQKAIQDDFVFIENPEASGAISQDTNILVFQKNLGKDTCVLRLLNADFFDAEQYLILQETLVEQLERDADRSDMPNIFLLDLLAGESIHPDFQKVIHGGEEFLGQRVYPVCWGVPLSQTEPLFISDKKQPTEIGNASSIISVAKALLFQSNPAEPDSIRDLHLKAVHSQPFNVRANVPVLTYAIILINAFMLALIYAKGGPDNLEALLDLGALEPGRVFRDGEYYRMFTVMLLHGGLSHFLSNSLGLYIFGTRVERYFGHDLFLFLYVLSGFGGSTLGLIFMNDVAVGASGAIYGLVGAALAMTVVSHKSMDGLPFYFFFMYSIIGISFGFFDPKIGNSAHIGGFITGLLAGYCICKIRKRRLSYG